MSILTTSAARTRSWGHRRNAQDQLLTARGQRTQPSSAQPQPHDEESDRRGTVPAPHFYEQRYNISLGYDEPRRDIIR